MNTHKLKCSWRCATGWEGRQVLSRGWSKARCLHQWHTLLTPAIAWWHTHTHTETHTHTTHTPHTLRTESTYTHRKHTCVLAHKAHALTHTHATRTQHARKVHVLTHALTQQVEAGQAFVAIVVLEPSKCESKSESFVYEWKQVKGPPVAIPTVSVTNQFFSLPGGSFLPSEFYAFQLSVVQVFFFVCVFVF